MGKGNHDRTGDQHTRGCKLQHDGEDDTVDGLAKAWSGGALGLVRTGGVPARFKTEKQKQMWLRLRAKQDAKTEN
tara:strand:- start:7 stop:231 length:225 start_codon:yes stop_codon:yes gene_type:complete